MYGSIVLNVYIALIAFIIVFTSSITQNLMQTSVIRATIAGVGFFLITFLFRFIWGYVTLTNKQTALEETSATIDFGSVEEKEQEISMNPSIDEEATAQYIKDLLEDEEV
ncbi:hypothetical protein [Alkalihalobacterium bogoriense]|uniref:hypothetical protein n=1 Tax=Alkalihalobacterium bogoriense TaxID=246272 RepID=UPI000553458F|nr:hypothetical protein [Alkalihalobacterium bogoriense]